ncbi:hypothetical protein Vretifemale_10674, partial [Volvox reticuliferus]
RCPGLCHSSSIILRNCVALLEHQTSNLLRYSMPTSHSFITYSRRCYVRSTAIAPTPSHHGELCGHRASWFLRPLCAVNNQHSHLDDEFMRMQSQLSVQASQTSHAWETHRKANSHAKHHVFHDTEFHPYQRQPQRHVHHEGSDASDGTGCQSGDLASAVELSYQYSSNILNYNTGESSLLRPVVHRARVPDYHHPSILARDLILTLLSGGKLLLELPDEPAAVSSLMTALGQAATELRRIGLATALDPVYDPAAAACYGNGAASYPCSAPGHTSSHSHNHNHNSHHNHNNHHHHHHQHTHNNSHGGIGGGSPSSSHDSIGAGNTAVRRSHDSGSVVFVFCARAVAIPHASSSAADGAASAVYTVGSSMGQEVLPVGPSVGVHSLLPALLRAILRDGLVTLRCCWFDEELGADSWPGGDRAAVTANESGNGGDKGDCEDNDGCDGSSLWNGGDGSPGRPSSPGITQAQPVAEALVNSTVVSAPAGSLVRVPCVLRAIFKLDRQLRGLDLGGLVVLPHTFARSCRDTCTQLLHLDIVIA